MRGSMRARCSKGIAMTRRGLNSGRSLHCGQFTVNVLDTLSDP